VKVELVTRRGCHLCQKAEALLARGGVEATLLDVDADSELFRLYDFRVPVLLADGRVIAEGRIPPTVLDRLGEA
jgi:glutaredoxin